MKSLALYYKCQATQPENFPEIELHINIWKVEEGKIQLNPCFYVDFGICVPFSVSNLKLYLPFQCEVCKDFDLGTLLEKRVLLSTVFNDDFSPSPMENHCYHVVTKNREKKFYLYKLGTNNFIKENCKEVGYEGSMIELKEFSDLDEVQNQNKEKRYMRFRVKVKDIHEIVKSEHISNDLLQAAFSKIDLFDIRINELREIHEKIHEKATREGFSLCKFSKIHVFYMADTKENIVNGSSLKIDSRMLEDSQWAEYEPKSDLKGVTYIAHHWNNKKKDNGDLIESFTLFFSTVYPSIDPWRLLAYFMTVLFTSCLGSFVISDLNLICQGDYNFYNMRVISLIVIFFYLFIYVIYTNFHFTFFSIERKR